MGIWRPFCTKKAISRSYKIFGLRSTTAVVFFSLTIITGRRVSSSSINDCVLTNIFWLSSDCLIFSKCASNFSLGLKQEIIRSCLTAVVVVTDLYDPCFLSREATLAIMKPTDVIALCIKFHTLAFVLLNSTVIHLPGFKIR